MLITLFSVLISAAFFFFTPQGIFFDPLYLTVIILVASTAVMLGTIFLYTFILMPLEQLEQKLVPNLMQIVRHDRTLQIGSIVLFSFTLFSFFSVAFLSKIPNTQLQDWIFLVWFILFGLSLDLFRDCWTRLVNLLNPTFLVEQISHHAFHAIQNDNQNDLMNQLDSLSEITLRSVEKSRLALSHQILQMFPPIVKTYFDSSKSISHFSPEIKNKTETLEERDESSYIIFYLLQRFELINDRALQLRQETVCRQMIVLLGKIVVSCARFDLSLVSFPVHFVTKFGLKALQHHYSEVAVLTTSTLQEVAKTILTEIDLTYSELEEPFKAIVNGLTALARATFKKEKNTNIKVLMQPLTDLKAQFQTEKMIHHRDTPLITRFIDDVLEEFSIVQQVMQEIPALPDLEMPPENPA